MVVACGVTQALDSDSNKFAPFGATHNEARQILSHNVIEYVALVVTYKHYEFIFVEHVLRIREYYVELCGQLRRGL